MQARAAELNAFRTVTAEAALEAARAAEAAVRDGAALGPLHGIPVAVKDNIAVAGVEMTAGTAVMSGHVPDEDAEVVRRLRGAGAVLVGKLHMSEWAIGGTNQNLHFGPARNPWDPERIPGGSSGGSGVAVAADMVPAALGSDTGGSIRKPAALCGVTGLRPTLGRVSNRGTIPMAWSFDTVGPLGRRAEDVARVFTVIAGFDPGDPVSAAPPAVATPVAPPGSGEAAAGAVRGLRVGLMAGGLCGEAPPAIRALVEELAVVLEGLGARVEATEVPGAEEAGARMEELMLAEAASFHAGRLERDPSMFAPDVRTRLARGAALSGAAYAAGRQAQRVFRRRMATAFQRHDVLLTPATPEEAPPIEGTDAVRATDRMSASLRPVAFAGVPALVVPCGLGPGGLPVGAQLVAPPWREDLLLAAGAAYQSATAWHLRRPAAA